MLPIRQRYLLLLHIPVYRDRQGVRWIDRLWYKDLVQHVTYIDDFTLACPCIEVDEVPADLVKVEEPRVKFVDLPGRRKLTLNLPKTAWRIWQAVGRAEVVHTGLGGWLPVSLGNLTSTMARLRGRFLFIIVESSPWRLVPGRPAWWLQRAKAAASEWVNRRVIGSTDLAVFTQAQYRDSLLGKEAARGHVIHASWIDADVISSEEEVERDLQRKATATGAPLKLLFAARLTAAKGVSVLLDAMRKLDAAGTKVELHIVGQGELLETCRQFQHELRQVTVRVLDPLPYGAPFFRFLHDYDAVLVPSLTDEQPRIVYDAYSQGVPVVASDTHGLRDCVDDGATGLLCKPGDAGALAELLGGLARQPQPLRKMSLAGLARAREMTHQHMHLRRWALLNEALKG